MHTWNDVVARADGTNPKPDRRVEKTDEDASHAGAERPHRPRQARGLALHDAAPRERRRVAKLLDGTVEMDHNFALGKDELERGYVLTCQSHPTSATVTVDYDAD